MVGDPENEQRVPEVPAADAAEPTVHEPAPGATEAAGEPAGEPQPEAAPPPSPPERSYGTGRRKTSVARVYLRPGSGQLRVNGRSLEGFFLGAQWREYAREPLVFLGAAEQYDAEIRVRGGGSSGQAGAVRLGLARALAAANPEMRVKLRREGFLTRNPRMKERKKYGQKGARRRFQWTKR